MNPTLHEIERLFQQTCHDKTPLAEKSKVLFLIFEDLVKCLSDTSALHFNTLFARVSYISTRFQLSRPWSYALQVVRKEIRQPQLPLEELLPILKASIEYLLALCKAEVHSENALFTLPTLPKLPPAKAAGRFKKRFARVIALECDEVNKQIIILDEDIPDHKCILHYCVEGVNDIYATTLELSLREIGLPVVLGLTDIDCTEEFHYIPSFIVIMPDLLVDVTSIAQVHPSLGDPCAINMIDLFLPSESNTALLSGHVANFFLDELVRNNNLSFDELFLRSFKIFPVEFVQLNDDQLKEMIGMMKNHFNNIRSVILERFPAVGIDCKECIIEPSYFSPQYGIKGRLDLYYHHAQENCASIVELKSGRPFMPNSYGLSNANYHQTLLYELLIRSVHGPQHHRANFILYSSSKEEPLRYAASVESLQKETIQNRNELVLLLFRMMVQDQPDSRDILQEIDPERNLSVKGFLRTNIQTWHKIYQSLSPGERSYLRHFTAFITREHMLARIGSEGPEGYGGLASLWLSNVEEKEENYQLLRGLKMIGVEITDQQTILHFRKSSLTDPLANFRAGDIAILYPYDEAETDPTKFQLYRANILSVHADEITVRLRNSQVHLQRMEQTDQWNIEHDLLDSSFRSLYQSLWHFISSDIRKRQLIFGLSEPARSLPIGRFPTPEGLTSHQSEIYHEGLNAESIYLLWGPPGTGKTSKMLKSWLWYYFFHTEKRIALLAYTNKAVDEICDAVCQLGPEISSHYIRIGSRAGTGETYRCRLLDHVIAPLQKRSEIRQVLDETRIFIGTIASLQGKTELFRLLTIDVAIFDEASQILEPSMTGLMTRFKKNILIGDHKQLPAVTVQSSAHSHVRESDWSGRIGLTDMGMSYFERIFRLYAAKGWKRLIGVLHEQGRMHADIQAYVNRFVYEDQLKCLNPESQTENLCDITGDHVSHLFSKRLVFIPATSELRETYLKTNCNETEVVIQLIKAWKRKINERSLNWSIGIITPFRAQIAAILHHAREHGIDMSNITVDTVERYQGGARDIVIMSCAVNHASTLARIVSMNDQQIDRKLNVAVTRSRQQFILIGNPDVLRRQQSYASLIEMCVMLNEVPKEESQLTVTAPLM